jgi:hypothetical protein
LGKKGERMRRVLIAACLAITLTGLAAGPAFAGKPSSRAGTSSIALESYSVLRLGGTVGFTTNAVGLAGWEYPMVSLDCYQNGSLVYIELNHPDHEFMLGGGGSTWLTNGGAAHCIATLAAYGKQSARPLATTEFDAAG